MNHHLRVRIIAAHSMKISRPCVERSEQMGQVVQAMGDQVAHAVLHFPLPVDG